MVSLFYTSAIFFFFFFLRAWEQAVGQKEKTKISSRLIDSDMGSIPDHEIMTWAEIKSRMLNWLGHPGAPIHQHFYERSHVAFITNVTRASGWLIWLLIQLWLRSWSLGLWVQAPHQAFCYQCRACFTSSVFHSFFCPLPCSSSLSLSLSLSQK